MKHLEETRLEAKTGDYKFIHIEDRETKKRYIRGTPKREWHSDIMDDFWNEAEEHGYEKVYDRFYSRGGGRVHMSETTLTAYGSSGSYGRFNQEIAKELLQRYIDEKLKECTLRIE